MSPARSPRSRPTPDPIAALPFDGPAFESRVTWIFGSPRTGSTWLLRMLVHPLTAGEEPSGLKRKGRGTATPAREIVVPVNESHLPLHLTPRGKLRVEAGDQSDPDQFLLNSRHLHRPSYFFSDAHAEATWPWVRSMILARFHSQAEAAMQDYGAQDCAVVVKEPNGSHGAARIMSLMPRAKLIFLIRDGRDVVDSALALRLPGGGRAHQGRGLRSDTGRLRYVKLGARLWVSRMNAVQRAYDAHDPDRRLQVRYEDLRSSTVEELSRIVEFLGLDRGRDDITAAVEEQAYQSRGLKSKEGESRQSASSGEWRTSLRPDEQRAAEDIMGPKLAELGYN